MTSSAFAPVQSHVVVAGESQGRVVVLEVALSFWGGYDSATGCIIDEHHPQTGLELAGAIVVMPTGRGSSSASSVLLEAARLDTAPAGLIMRESDEIIATGAIVAQELYGRPLPVVLVDDAGYSAVAAAEQVAIAVDGTITAID